MRRYDLPLLFSAASRHRHVKIYSQFFHVSFIDEDLIRDIIYLAYNRPCTTTEKKEVKK